MPTLRPIWRSIPWFQGEMNFIGEPGNGVNLIEKGKPKIKWKLLRQSDLNKQRWCKLHSPEKYLEYIYILPEIRNRNPTALITIYLIHGFNSRGDFRFVLLGLLGFRKLVFLGYRYFGHVSWILYFHCSFKINYYQFFKNQNFSGNYHVSKIFSAFGVVNWSFWVVFFLNFGLLDLKLTP